MFAHRRAKRNCFQVLLCAPRFPEKLDVSPSVCPESGPTSCRSREIPRHHPTPLRPGQNYGPAKHFDYYRLPRRSVRLGTPRRAPAAPVCSGRVLRIGRAAAGNRRAPTSAIRLWTLDLGLRTAIRQPHDLPPAADVADGLLLDEKQPSCRSISNGSRLNWPSGQTIRCAAPAEVNTDDLSSRQIH